tara:strand:- start:5454 stop:5756 length:303 start_codon:yes stop_codon:yes gene_type:complete
MKKIYLLMCILGIVFPYYHLINFLSQNEWSMNGFWGEIFSSHPISMISMDLTVAATTFLIFIIHRYKTKKINPTKYLISLFLVGFSLALPLYLYDNHVNK